jgi:hypothetical protein
MPYSNKKKQDFYYLKIRVDIGDILSINSHKQKYQYQYEYCTDDPSNTFSIHKNVL